MPFYWRQTPNLRYKPSPELVPGKDHLVAAMKHFDLQIELYGRQVLINLVCLCWNCLKLKITDLVLSL